MSNEINMIDALGVLYAEDGFKDEAVAKEWFYLMMSSDEKDHQKAQELVSIPNDQVIQSMMDVVRQNITRPEPKSWQSTAYQVIQLIKNDEVEKLGQVLNKIGKTKTEFLNAVVARCFDELEGYNYTKNKRVNITLGKDCIECGVDPNVSSPEWQKTFLHYAVGLDNLVLIRGLLDLGVDVNSVNQFGRTPLFGFQSKAAVDILIDAGADLYHQDKGDRTVFEKILFSLYNTYVPAHGNICYDWEEREVHKADILLECGYDINHHNDGGNTALMRLIFESREISVPGMQYLLSKPELDIDIQNVGGLDAVRMVKLHIFSSYRKKAQIKKLIKAEMKRRERLSPQKALPNKMLKLS